MKMSTGDGRPRGRPRDELLTRRIIEATLALLHEGAEAPSLEAVARRAAVSRPSIYKRWPTLAALLLDATLEARLQALSPGQAFPVPDTGSLIGDLQALVQMGTALFQDLERGGVIQVLFAEAIRSAELAQRLEQTILAPDESALRAIFSRAAERGEWPSGSGEAMDREALLLLRSLIGHAVFERYVLHREFDDILSARLAEIVSKGTRPERD